MSALTRRLKGTGTGIGDPVVVRGTLRHGERFGIRLPDGTVYPLEGQPPCAVSHGWGNLSFLYPPSR